MEIRIVSKIEEFQALQSTWVSLFNSDEYSVFQSFEFNYYSWEFELSKNALHHLCIVLLKNRSDIFAILPLYIDAKKRLRFINDDHADFCDFISKEEVSLLKVYNYLKLKLNFKSVRFRNIKHKSNLYISAVQLNMENKVVKSISEYSSVNLEEGSFPYNVKHYRSHQKHRINKASRKYQDSNSVIFSSNEHHFPKKEILLLRDKMIDLGFRQYDFLTNERLCLIEHLYNSGFLILHVVKHKDKMNSCNIIMRKSPVEFMFWIDLFDESKMINIFSYIRFMQFVSSRSSVAINFGRGRYFYKVSNFAPFFEKLYQIEIYHTKWDKLKAMIINYIIDLLAYFSKKITS